MSLEILNKIHRYVCQLYYVQIREASITSES